MSRAALLPAAFLLLLGAASAAPSHLGPQKSAVALSARAGVGGVGRPGRWLPVDATISGGATGAHGVLRVEWGDAVTLRDIDVAADAVAHLTIMLRAIAAAPVVHLSMNGEDAGQAIDVPVELAALEEPLTLCIGDASSACTVRISDDAAPTTWRGFDMADVVLWPSADRSTRHDVTRALATWRAMRWMGDSGPADPVLPPFDTRTPAASATANLLAMITGVTLLLVVILAWRRAPVTLTLGVPVLASIAGVAMFSTTTFGPSDIVSLQMTGVVHQFADTPQSTFSGRASVEHPSDAPLWLRPTLRDATITTTGDAAVRSVSIEDHSGYALYRATEGLGTQRRWTLDGTIDTPWLEVTADHTVKNRAPFALSDCMWHGATTEPIGTLRPETSAALNPRHTPEPGDTIVCALPIDWLAWTSTTAHVDVRGQQFFVFHFWPAPQEAPHAAR